MSIRKTHYDKDKGLYTFNIKSEADIVDAISEFQNDDTMLTGAAFDLLREIQMYLQGLLD